MSAIAAVSRRDGSAASVSQSSGQPSSYCGQSPCRVKPRSRFGSHCSSRSVALGGAPARRPGQREHVVVEPLRPRRRSRERDAEQGRRKPLYHRAHPHLYTRSILPRKPTFALRRSRVFGTGRGLFDERDPAMALPLMQKATAVWLVENTTLTFRQIAEFMRAARARGERHRRRRGGAGHQGLRPGRQPPAHRRGDPPRRGRPELPAPALPQPRRRGRDEAQGSALHSTLQAAGPAGGDRLAGQVPPGALRRPDRQARRHHQADHPVDPRPQPLEYRQRQPRSIRSRSASPSRASSMPPSPRR